MLYTHDQEMNGSRSYLFNSGLAAIQFATLFKGTIATYHYAVDSNGKQSHTYTVIV